MPSVEFNSNVVKKVFHNSNVVKKLFLNGAMVWQDAVLPAGIIIGYTGTTVPNGWTLFSSANDKLIVGAGGSYIVGTRGGNNSVSKTLSISSSGSHSTGVGVTVTSGSTRGYGGGTTSGAHTHTVTASGTYNPYRHRLGLIKALVDSNVPIGGVIFSGNNISTEINANNINATSAYLSANDTLRTTTGSDIVTLLGVSTSSGAHNHGNKSASGSETSYDEAETFTTTHTHTVSVSITPNVKSKYLAAWSNAIEEISICPNVIGMWEGTAIPEGWAVCNGTNGTPDLRDYFIRLGDKTVAGNVFNVGGSTSIPSVSTNSNSHSHSFYLRSTDSGVQGGHSTSISHSHTTVADSVTIEPSYYALTFIMKLP